MKMKKIYCVIFGNYGKLKNPKISYIFQKTLVLSVICSRYEMKEYLKKKNQLRY